MLRLLVVAACILPVAAALVLILLLGENVAVVDDWQLVALLQKVDAGQFELADVFDQHVAHRIPFPLLVMLALALVTDFNSVTLMVASFAVLAASIATLLVMYRRRFAGDDPLCLGFVPIAFLAFSLAQFGTLLNGFSMTYAMGLGGAVVSLACLELAMRAGHRGPWFAAAILAATVASFSATMGLFVWWAGLLLIVVAASGRSKRGLALVWISIGVFEWFAYFLGFEFAKTGQVTLLPFLTAPTQALQFASTLLGHTLFREQATSLWGGAVLSVFVLVAIASVIRGGRTPKLSFWIAVLFFFSVSAHSVVQARMTMGIEQALTSHYCCITLPIVVCTYVLLLDAWMSSRSKGSALAFGAFLILVLASIPSSFTYGLKGARAINAERRHAAFILHTYETQPNAFLRKLHPAGRAVRRMAPFLEQQRLNAFSEPMRLPGDPGRVVQTELEYGDLFQLNGVTFRPRPDEPTRIPKGHRIVHVVGWAIDPIAQSPAGGVLIEVDGRRFPAFYGQERPNLAAARGEPYRYSGYERALDLLTPGLGPHELSILVLTADQSAVLAPIRRYELIVE